MLLKPEKTMEAIRTIYWEDGAVVMIDQKALPHEERTIVCHRPEEVAAAICDLTVRGAPAIGVAAAMGIALGMQAAAAQGWSTPVDTFYSLYQRFAATRPTARNLFWALERMERRFAQLQHLPTDEVVQALVSEAIAICTDDITANRRLGKQGRRFIADGACILTHCNAGALATAGYGTALGVIRAAREEGKQVHVFVDETRPLLQGARLTAWELMKERIPTTLITDSMAGFLMQQGRIDLVITGADRIAANGDTANKIGTYTLAVLAREHGVPFYIAAPLSSVDLAVADGTGIPIEERSGEEVRCFAGVATAPAGIPVYNPAFDVTPARFITAIITEAGIAQPPYGGSLPPLFATSTLL